MGGFAALHRVDARASRLVCCPLECTPRGDGPGWARSWSGTDQERDQETPGSAGKGTSFDIAQPVDKRVERSGYPPAVCRGELEKWERNGAWTQHREQVRQVRAGPAGPRPPVTEVSRPPPGTSRPSGPASSTTSRPSSGCGWPPASR